VSGGSYNYLCYAEDISTLGDRVSDLQEMIARLAEIPGAEAARAASAQVLATMEHALRQAQDLHDVWHAVEWHDSCDWSEDQMLEAIQAFSEGSERHG
jgi:hypothetical protein